MLSLINLINYIDNKTNNTLSNTNKDTLSSANGNTNLIINCPELTYLDKDFIINNYAYVESYSLLNQLLYCLYQSEIGITSNKYDIYDREYIYINDIALNNIKSKLLKELNDSNDEIINLMNKKKINQLIKTDQYNHELILLYSIIYDLNIFVYYCDTNLFKVYYKEEELCKYKKNIFIQFGRGNYSSTETFQKMKFDDNLEWTEKLELFINKNKTNMYAINFAFIPFNKIFKISNSLNKTIINQSKEIIYDITLHHTLFINKLSEMDLNIKKFLKK